MDGYGHQRREELLRLADEFEQWLTHHIGQVRAPVIRHPRRVVEDQRPNHLS
ncbi:hypothetical protein ACIRBZ_23425 [Streptomyces sp. NPDC094038]|uniref:hypothetical protein n=1 Tax=Streptomyces sp. NPDC094038 TaxID=3366055 RepID=UPI00382C915F